MKLFLLFFGRSHQQIVEHVVVPEGQRSQSADTVNQGSCKFHLSCVIYSTFHCTGSCKGGSVTLTLPNVLSVVYFYWPKLKLLKYYNVNLKVPLMYSDLSCKTNRFYEVSRQHLILFLSYLSFLSLETSRHFSRRYFSITAL